MTGNRTEALIEISELLHFSLIGYSIPAERARSVLPPEFASVAGESLMLTVTSYIDSGVWLAGGGRDAFERTDYRLNFRGSDNWLIGTSLGSLSAVTQRHYWSRPWHLSAIEFEVRYDGQRYRDYRILSQSQWANSYWAIEDSGESRDQNSIEPRSKGYFRRRDGQFCAEQTSYYDLQGTVGRLRSARCDLLTRLGLLTPAELLEPSLVILQPRVRTRYGAPGKPAEEYAWKSVDAAVSGMMATQC